MHCMQTMLLQPIFPLYNDVLLQMVTLEIIYFMYMYAMAFAYNIKEEAKTWPQQDLTVIYG